MLTGNHVKDGEALPYAISSLALCLLNPVDYDTMAGHASGMICHYFSKKTRQYNQTYTINSLLCLIRTKTFTIVISNSYSQTHIVHHPGRCSPFFSFFARLRSQLTILSFYSTDRMEGSKMLTDFPRGELKMSTVPLIARQPI